MAHMDSFPQPRFARRLPTAEPPLVVCKRHPPESSLWISSSTIHWNCGFNHASRRLHFAESELHNSSVLRLESPSGSDAMVDERRDGKYSRRSSKTPRPISGRPYPILVSLDARMATALKQMIQNSNLRTLAHLE